MQVEEKLLRINIESLFSLLKFILESVSCGFPSPLPFLETIEYA